MEPRIEQQIREAQERGEFENLPGAGKPIPDLDKPYDENWWAKGLLAREGLPFTGPPALALRKEIKELPQRLARETAELSVREIIKDLNERIIDVRRRPAIGAPVVLETIDVDQAVEAWRAHRASSA